MTDAEFALILEKLHEAFGGPGGPADRLEDLPGRLKPSRALTASLATWDLMCDGSYVAHTRANYHVAGHLALPEVLARSPLWLVAAMKEIQTLQGMLADVAQDHGVYVPLTPHAAMNEILRLRAALRQIAAEGKGLTLVKIAREALGEEP